MQEGSYPARIDGVLDPETSRWLWIFKGLLLIPHFIVLVFLWLAAIVLTIIAGFAILLTARYPRWIFDFNVGVMRWSWRVGFYSLNAFATDEYPPFSLRSNDKFPADLSVDYPERPSRGLVLIKWWLLVLPQYLIVAIFNGGWDFGHGSDRVFGGPGLITLLAFFAAIALLFTGRYPQQFFDLIMGLNRWVLRVFVYAALMRDEYPPFRLDQGGTDPGHSPGPAPESPGPSPVPLPAV
jgi:hypothetical protein